MSYGTYLKVYCFWLIDYGTFLVYTALILMDYICKPCKGLIVSIHKNIVNDNSPKYTVQLTGNQSYDVIVFEAQFAALEDLSLYSQTITTQ